MAFEMKVKMNKKSKIGGVINEEEINVSEYIIDVDIFSSDCM